MGVFRLLTDLTFAANAFALSILLFITVRAAYLHHQLANISNMALMVVLSVVILAMLKWCLSRRRREAALVGADTILKKVGLALLSILVFGVVLIGAAGIITTLPSASVATALFILVYAFLMLTAFILPGWAYWRPRAAEAMPSGYRDVYSPASPSEGPAPEAYGPSIPMSGPGAVYHASTPQITERDVPDWLERLPRLGQFGQSVMTVILGTPILVSLCFPSFLPSPEHAEAVARFWPPIFVAALVIATWAGLSVIRIALQNGRGTWLGPVVFLVLFAATLVSLHLWLMATGPQLTASFFAETPTTQTVPLVRRGSSVNSKQCNNQVKVGWPGSDAVNQTLCYAPSELWRMDRMPETLVLYGYHTPFGFKVAEIRLPRSN